MTDAERAREVRRLVAERFGLRIRAAARAGTDEQGEPTCSEDLRKIHSRAHAQLSAGRRLAAWPVAERAAYFPERAQTAEVFLPKSTGGTTANARSAQPGPDVPASHSQDG